MPLPEHNGGAEGARLVCLALTYAAPILSQIVKLVHELRTHPHPKVRALAQKKLPAPQQVDDEGKPRKD